MLRNAPFALKLTVSLALTVLVAVGSLAAVVNYAVERRFEDYVSFEVRPRALTFVAALAAHYAVTGSWEDASKVLQSGLMGQTYGQRQVWGPSTVETSMSLILADAEGRVVVDSSGRYVGTRLRGPILRQAYLIQVNGRTVGYLVAPTGPREQQFSDGLNESVALAGAFASLVAIVLGLLLTRTVTKPLRVLRDAAQRIAAGDLAQRVPVHARDEIGDLAQHFNEMAAALEHDETLRRNMMADTAHELRTPLSVIRGQVEAMEDGVFELSLQNLVPIHDQVLLLSRLVDDLRDLALVEAGRLPMERTDVDMESVARRAVAAFQQRAREKGVALVFDGRGPLPLVVADPQRMGQVLGNLLSNAIRHTPPEGVVTVRVWSEPSSVLVAVQDTGSGIAPEELAHLFDRFYRIDKARARAEGGTGLGLSIAKQLVEAQGGQISVESAVGSGAKFTVRLPSLRQPA